MRFLRHLSTVPRTSLLALLAAALLMLGLPAGEAAVAVPGIGKTGNLTVVIHGTDGKAAADATVVAAYQGGATAPQASSATAARTATTGADGQVTFSGISEGKWRINATGADKTSGNGGATVTAGGSATVTVRLAAGHTTSSRSTARTGDLVVTVQDGSGAAAVNATVVIKHAAATTQTSGTLPTVAPVPTSKTGTTDAAGKATFVGIATGAWTITATTAQKQRATGTVTVAANQVATATVKPVVRQPKLPTVSRTNKLVVTVHGADGKAVANATVVVAHRDSAKDTGTRKRGTTDAAGKATFADLAVGAWAITATGTDTATGTGHIIMKAGATATVTVTITKK